MYIYLYNAVPICPVTQIEYGAASNCSITDKCHVNSTMKYSCNPGYITATTTTKCLNNHKWDPEPTCIAGNNLCTRFIATYSNLQQ